MNIGFFCYSPASINSFKALLVNRELQFEMFVYLQGSQAKKFFFADYEKLDLTNVTKKNNLVSLLESCDIVFYGTGSGDSIELEFPLRCKTTDPNVITIAINDIFWDSEQGILKRYKNVPNYIIVSTAFEKQVLLNTQKIQPEQILLFGNPHFDRLKHISNIPNRSKKSVSFISQCGNGGTYDEPTGLECQNAIIELARLKNKGVISELIIYKHPRENLSFYNKIGIVPSQTNDFLDMIRSDYIISNGSTPHYEAILLKKNNLFIAKGNLEYRLTNNESDSFNFKFKGNSRELLFSWLKSSQETPKNVPLLTK